MLLDHASQAHGITGLTSEACSIGHKPLTINPESVQVSETSMGADLCVSILCSPVQRSFAARIYHVRRRAVLQQPHHRL